MNKVLQILYLVIFILVSFSACSGGDVNFPGVTVNGPLLPPQTSEAVTAYGVITGLNDLTINDVQYASSNATVTFNGQLATLSDLSPGQIVTVKGTINSYGWAGTANSIRFDANLIGPAESLDASTGRLIVMGQTVMTGPTTLFGAGIDPVTFSGLTAGSTVQISGFSDAAGALHATRINAGLNNTEHQLIGRVAALDPGNLLFSVNGLTVDYSAAILIDVPGGAPTNGMKIMANGTLSGGIFAVERLVAAGGLDGSTGQRVQIAGMITRFGTLTDFDINGLNATANTSTAFTNGDARDLGVNTELFIDGELAASGRIMADRIRLGHLVGQTATVQYDLRDFSEISVPTAFQLTVTQGADYSVEIQVDDHIADRVDVTKTGSRLNIDLIPGGGNIDTLHAYVTMPVLDRVDLTGPVNASLNNFNQAQMTINVGGVSRVHGNALTIRHLTATVSGVSQLNLGDIRPIESAHIDVSGVSRATLNMDVNSTLTGSVATGQGTGLSTLFYYGTNVAMNLTTDSRSSVVNSGRRGLSAVRVERQTDIAEEAALVDRPAAGPGHQPMSATIPRSVTSFDTSQATQASGIRPFGKFVLRCVRLCEVVAGDITTIVDRCQPRRGL